MVRKKSQEEIELLAEGGKHLFTLLEELEYMARPGVTGKKLDDYARAYIDRIGAKPSFLGYRGFPAAVCVSINDAVVHGMPTEEPFKDGDIIGIDAGLIYKGLYTDSARTVAVGTISNELQNLLDVTKESLRIGIEAALVGNTTGDIGHAVQTYVEDQGLGVVRQLVGHGVGYGVHEEPQVPNFGKAGSGYELSENLVIAVEPMVTIGNPKVETAADDWTVITRDGGPAAHFEHTIAIAADGPRILTL